MHITDDLTTVRTNLDAATAAQSYYQAQISQLSYDVAQLREQLKNITEQQSSVTAAPHMTTPPLNPTATAYCPQSPTPSSGGPAPLPEQTQDPSRPLTGAVHVSPAPGTPAASPTPSPQPALPRARNTTGGFAAAFKSAVSKSKARSSPAKVQPTRGSPASAGTSPPPSAPTTELTPSPSGYSAGDAVKRMLDLAQVGSYSDCYEGDY
jgi:hypothetical protein